MTGTNSSNDRLVLRQNVEINSNEYFSVTYFFGNEIVDHVAWKCHCAITKKNVFVFRVISTIYYGLLNDYRWKFSVIHHFLRLMMSFSFYWKTFSHNGSAFLGEMCPSASLVAWTTQISRHRSSDWDNIGLSCRLNRLNKHSRWDEWQDKVSFCSLIRFNWRVPARVPLFSLRLKVPRSPFWPQREAVRGCVNPLLPTWG